MSQLFKTISTLTSTPIVSRRRGHRAVAKKVGAARVSRHHSEGKVQWEMMPISVIHYDQPENTHPAPLWFKGALPSDEAHLDCPLSPPVAPVRADLRLPFELWIEVFHHLDDGYDIHALARVCKGLQDVAQEAVEQHAAFVKIYRVAELCTYESMMGLLESATSSTAIAFAVRDLSIRCDTYRWELMPLTLVRILQALPNLRSLHLRIPKAEVVSCFHAGISTIKLRHLRTFSSLVYTPEILRFTQSHPEVQCDLSITSDTYLEATTLGQDPELPAVRSLQCELSTLTLFRHSTVLTHLHILLHVPNTLESIASLLGAQLVSLRLGVLERLPDLHSPGIVWSPHDILTRFPRLAYIQMQMFEPDLLPQPIQWHQKRDRSVKMVRPTPLTVAWVLNEEAWGTLLDPRDSDIVRQLFDEVAFEVLRHWTPYINRVVYGDSGVPDTAVVLGAKGNKIIHINDGSLGEDYWKLI